MEGRDGGRDATDQGHSMMELPPPVMKAASGKPLSLAEQKLLAMQAIQGRRPVAEAPKSPKSPKSPKTPTSPSNAMLQMPKVLASGRATDLQNAMAIEKLDADVARLQKALGREQEASARLREELMAERSARVQSEAERAKVAGRVAQVEQDAEQRVEGVRDELRAVQKANIRTPAHHRRYVHPHIRSGNTIVRHPHTHMHHLCIHSSSSSTTLILHTPKTPARSTVTHGADV